jgi:hypothetical protein
MMANDRQGWGHFLWDSTKDALYEDRADNSSGFANVVSQVLEVEDSHVGGEPIGNATNATSRRVRDEARRCRETSVASAILR